MEKKVFRVRIDQLQPSQPYLSRARLDNILRNTGFILRPVGVRELKGRYCVIEGHERCFALNSLGYNEVEVFIDTSAKDENIWQDCVKITIEEGVAAIADLGNRILSPALFKQNWVMRKKLLGDRLSYQAVTH